MARTKINGLEISFEHQDRNDAEKIALIASEAAYHLTNQWGLQRPRGLHVCVMTSLPKFLWFSTPWICLPVVLPLLPLRCYFGRRIWAQASGLTERWRTRPTVGIKSARLIETSDKSVGGRIFTPDLAPDVKLRSIVAHELMHAYTARCRLPMWLSEGCAMLASDSFLGFPTVRQDTIQRLSAKGQGRRPKPYHRIAGLSADGLADAYIRAYWIAKYLDGNHPVFLRAQLQRRYSLDRSEKALARELSMKRRSLWRDIDDVVASYFAERETADNRASR